MTYNLINYMILYLTAMLFFTLLTHINDNSNGFIYVHLPVVHITGNNNI